MLCLFQAGCIEAILTDWPRKILGVLPLGTSMDNESASSRELGAWNPKNDLAPFLEKWTTAPNPAFVVDEVWRGMVASLGFSGTVGKDVLSFWDQTVKDVYSGENGRKKLRMALINLMERDGLLRRVRDIKCPVYWLQGTQDVVFGVKIPAEHIKLFTSSPEATLTFVEGGGHYLNATSPKQVEEAILKMVRKYA